MMTHHSLGDWIAAHATSLTTTDPQAPLDDLEPLRELIGDARIVALGENSHFIQQFADLRLRILRFLVERCGFSVYAFEYGFSEGLSIDAWVRGAGDDNKVDEYAISALPVGIEPALHWMRRYNRDAPRVRFAGMDLAESGGSLLPVLRPLRDYLRQYDSELMGLTEEAIGFARRLTAGSAALTAPTWDTFSNTEKDALTAILARLRNRVVALEPLYVSRGGQYAYDVARRQAEAAFAADYMLRAMAAVFAGRGWDADASSRDAFMADSVDWHLRQAGPDARIVIAAHNAHIQRTSVSYDGKLTSLPLGQHLAHRHGRDYFALALTSQGGNTADMRLDSAAPFGFTVADNPLGQPAAGSVEAALEAGGVSQGLVGWRAAIDDGEVARIRMHSGYMEAPLRAFDGVATVPESTVIRHPDYAP